MVGESRTGDDGQRAGQRRAMGRCKEFGGREERRPRERVGSNTELEAERIMLCEEAHRWQQTHGGWRTATRGGGGAEKEEARREENVRKKREKKIFWG